MEAHYGKVLRYDVKWIKNQRLLWKDAGGVSQMYDQFCEISKKPPDKIELEDIKKYQIYLVEERKVSWCTFNQNVCALRFFYKVTLNKDWNIKHIPFQKKRKKLPDVLSQDKAFWISRKSKKENSHCFM